MKSFAELYLSSEFYADEANQSIGKPAITENVIIARRNVTRRLTEEGKQHMYKLLAVLSQLYGRKVVAKWDIYCGCTCPCSPGFRLMYESYTRLRADGRVNLWINKDGSVTYRRPADSWMDDEKLKAALAKEFEVKNY